jgi:hypothetical protein
MAGRKRFLLSAIPSLPQPENPVKPSETHHNEKKLDKDDKIDKNDIGWSNGSGFCRGTTRQE